MRILAFEFLLLAMILGLGCQGNSSKSDQSKLVKSPSGLQYEIIREGKGEPAREGQQVLFHEDVTYKGGRFLYSTRAQGRPLQILLGGNMAIEGIDEGIRGMKPGEFRRLTIPPELSRRTSYPDNVSPDSTLVIVVELLQVL